MSGIFRFRGFAEHFPEGDDSDTPELYSENVIECAGGKLRFELARSSGKIEGYMSRCDGGVMPLQITWKIWLQSGPGYLLDTTFLPDWCKDSWTAEAQESNDAHNAITDGAHGWPEFPIPLVALRQAAAQANGVLNMPVEITATRSASSTLAGHESCLRDNVPNLLAGLVGSPGVQLVGPDGMRVELPQALLCAHSTVLRAALEGPMEEGQTRSIRVGDLKRQALLDFSVCLCSGGLPAALVTDWQRLLDLLVVADKYCVHALVDACISLLSVAISTKTVAPLMKAADEAGFTKLMRCLLYYCLGCTDRMRFVIDSDEFSHFSADLLRNIFAHQECLELGRFLKYPTSLQYLEVGQEFHDATDWSTLSTSELRRACFERDLSSSGTSAEIVTRLSLGPGGNSSCDLVDLGVFPEKLVKA